MARKVTRRTLRVNWGVCNDGRWCQFRTASFAALEDAKGVYVIWQPKTPTRQRQTIYVGQDLIRTRIYQHRANAKIRRAVRGRTPLVTWIEVPSAGDRNGIERYLADRLNPIVGEEWPRAAPIPVTLPRL